MMTMDEAIKGFAEGNKMIQQLDHITTAAELNLVDECIKNGLCTAGEWFMHYNTGYIRREMTGIIKENVK